MAENLGGHKRVKNQYKHYDMVLKERMSQEIGTLLNTFLDEGYMSKSLIKADFGIDYKTTADLLHAASSCSFGTMRKFAYVFAFYLHQAELEAKNIKYIVKHDEKMAEIHHNEEAFKAIYGIEATCVLEQIKQHKDLRQVVRQEQNS